MKNRKTLAIVFAMLSVFMIAGIAAAQNQVAVSVTSEPLRAAATCDKAGGFSLQFDNNTTLVVGDVITIDTDLYTTLCRNININIGDGDGTTPWTAAEVLNNTNTDAIYYVDDANGTVGTLTSGNGGIYFAIRGTAGTQRITVTVAGAANGSMTVGPDSGDKLIVKFLDQDYTWNDPGVYYDLNADGIYNDLVDTVAEMGYNTLCINISNPLFTGTKVQGNMDSAGDKFTFIPSNPQIAHIVPPQAYELYQCKGKLCGYVLLGSAPNQQSPTCVGFDNEDNTGGVYTDYCSSYVAQRHSANNVIIRRTDAPFAVDNYNIRLTILVNGAAGDNGVYFTNEAVRVGVTNSSSTACAYVNDAGNVVSGTTSYFSATGAPITPAAESSACTVALTARAVSLVTADQGFGLDGTQNYMFINIPEMEYDTGFSLAGKQVTVRVELTRAPCGLLFTGDACIANLVNVCPTAPVLTVGQILFPYFTNMANGDGWWDGIVVDNLTATAGTYVATIYEKDGDVGSYTSGTVAARSQDVQLLTAILASATKTSGSGTLGDSSCYIIVTSNWGATDGFGMIGSTTNDVNGSESMGYLPRVQY